MATIITSSQDSEAMTIHDYRQVVARLGEIAIEQISTADNALSDWEDIVPDDVRELRQALSARSQGEHRNA